MTTPTGRLAGKRAIVTGASLGIGRATAIRFAAEGARVGLIARRPEPLEAVAREIADAGGEALALPADVGDEGQVSAAIDRAAEAWGGLDIVVSNAGIEVPDEDAPVHRLDLAVWQRIMATNLTGQFLACKHGVRHLLEAGGGAVVCVGSPVRGSWASARTSRPTPRARPASWRWRASWRPTTSGRASASTSSSPGSSTRP